MKKWVLFVLTIFSFGCGVKGKPMPPLEPPTLSRGDGSVLEQPTAENADPKAKKKNNEPNRR